MQILTLNSVKNTPCIRTPNLSWAKLAHCSPSGKTGRGREGERGYAHREETRETEEETEEKGEKERERTFLPALHGGGSSNLIFPRGAASLNLSEFKFNEKYRAVHALKNRRRVVATVASVTGRRIHPLRPTRPSSPPGLKVRK